MFNFGEVITNIRTIDGDEYINKEFTEEQQRELDERKIREAKKEEERKYRAELEKIRQESLVA